MGLSGEVAEWSNALDLKSSDVKASVGSNPTLSVFYKQSIRVVKQYIKAFVFRCAELVFSETPIAKRGLDHYSSVNHKLRI